MSLREQGDPMLEFEEKLLAFGKATDALDRFLTRLAKKVAMQSVMVAYWLGVAFTLTVLASPLLLASDNGFARSVAAALYALAGGLRLCHQLPYRSITFGGIPMAVCARDAGIYVGAALGAITPLAARKQPKIFASILVLAVAVAPIALDGVTQTLLGLRESNNLVRVVTGFAFGFGVFVYLVNKLLAAVPDFKATVTGKVNLAASLLAAVLILYFASALFTGFGAGFAARSELAGGSQTIYLTPNAVNTIPHDPYLDAHESPLTRGVVELSESGADGKFGFWVVEGADGGLNFIDPETGETVLKK